MTENSLLLTKNIFNIPSDDTLDTEKFAEKEHILKLFFKAKNGDVADYIISL